MLEPSKYVRHTRKSLIQTTYEGANRLLELCGKFSKLEDDHYSRIDDARVIAVLPGPVHVVDVVVYVETSTSTYMVPE